jgi:ParB family chromosome partitioning protein
MTNDAKPRGLGRGLSALLGDNDDDYAQLDRLRSQRTVPVELLRPGRQQPRQHMDEAGLRELAQSLREKGMLQPILVRRCPDDPQIFEIVAGERRWRAAQLAALHDVPVIVREFNDAEALEIALVENLQRQDLNPLEEAEGYRRLLEEYGHSQEDLARILGKSRSHVANMVRLLALPPPVRQMLEQGALTAGHARALLAAADPETLAQEVVNNGLNVRRTEDLVRGDRPRAPRGPASTKDANTQALERDLSTVLGLKVEIRFRGRGGALVLHYQSLEQLDDILHRLHNAGSGSASRLSAAMPDDEPAAVDAPEPQQWPPS